MHTVTLVSINFARATTIEIAGRPVTTGHFKEPRQGTATIQATGLVGDEVCDLARHGGADQAVYLYSAEDIHWWATQLCTAILPGYFGENLTIDRWWPSPRVGDRLSLGSVELELSFPRIPCATLAARVGDPRFLKAFVAAGRPGAYARVIKTGEVEPGCTGTARPADHVNPLLADLFGAWHTNPKDRAMLRAALHAPLAQRARAAFEHWLRDDPSAGHAAARPGD